MIDSFQELIIRTDHPKPMILLESMQPTVDALLDVAENIENSGEVLNIARGLIKTLAKVIKL